MSIAMTVLPPLPADEPRLVEAVQSHGGFVRAEDLIQTLRRRSSQPLSCVARWIVQRDVVSVRRCDGWWLPRFQFSASEIAPLPIVRLVAEEFNDVLDEVELVNWFFRPNASLEGCLPACAIHDRADHVYRAARADRWVARG